MTPRHLGKTGAQIIAALAFGLLFWIIIRTF